MRLFSTLILSVLLTFPVFSAEKDQPLSDTFIENLNVFPNPSSNGEFSIKFENHSGEPLVIKVYNLIGAVVYVQNFNENHPSYFQTISLKPQPKGVYILEVSSGAKKQTRRLSYI